MHAILNDISDEVFFLDYVRHKLSVRYTNVKFERKVLKKVFELNYKLPSKMYVYIR